MKKIFLVVFIVLAGAQAVFARPEIVKLKSEKQKKQQDLGRARAASLRLSKIKDPEVRNALQAAFDSMGISVKK